MSDQDQKQSKSYVSLMDIKSAMKDEDFRSKLPESLCECWMKEEVEEDLQESFKQEKEKITEMFNRFKKWKKSVNQINIIY